MRDREKYSWADCERERDLARDTGLLWAMVLVALAASLFAFVWLWGKSP